MGDGNTFGPSVYTSGSCEIGNCNLFGMMIGIEPKISVGSNNIISSGLIITNHIRNDLIIRNPVKIEEKKIKS